MIADWNPDFSKLRGTSMAKKKHTSTTAGVFVVTVSVCLGLLFGVTLGPMCWHCWSWNPQLIPGKPFVFLSSPGQVYYCQTCASVWKIGEPWNSIPFNPNAIPHKAVEEAEAKKAAEEWEREKDAPYSTQVPSTATSGTATFRIEQNANGTATTQVPSSSTAPR